jgi:hypothetical protein
MLEPGDRRGAHVEVEIQTFTAFVLYDELARAGLAPPAAARCLEAIVARAFPRGKLIAIARYLYPVDPSPDIELANRIGELCAPGKGARSEPRDARALVLALLSSHRAELRVAAGFVEALAG